MRSHSHRDRVSRPAVQVVFVLVGDLQWVTCCDGPEYRRFAGWWCPRSLLGKRLRRVWWLYLFGCLWCWVLGHTNLGCMQMGLEMSCRNRLGGRRVLASVNIRMILLGCRQFREATALVGVVVWQPDVCFIYRKLPRVRDSKWRSAVALVLQRIDS